MYGHTDLGDFYRDRLTLRQIYVRIIALPAEAPTWRVLEKWDAEAKAADKEREVRATLAQFTRP